MVDIIPGITEKDPERIKEKIVRVVPFVKKVHIDVEDGKFTSLRTVTDFSDLEISRPGLEIEWHLMVVNPEEYLYSLSLIDDSFILCAVESLNKGGNFIGRAKELDFKVGLSAGLDTPLSDINHYLPEIDYICFMAVGYGAEGQKFIPSVVDKIKQFRKNYPDFPIQVDGGINPETARLCVKAGANLLVSTSYIGNSDNVKEAIDNLSKFN